MGKPKGGSKANKGNAKLLKLFADTIAKAQPFHKSFAFECQYTCIKEPCVFGVFKFVRWIG